MFYDLFFYFCTVMMEKTRAIVLHSLRYADAKVIVTLFTESRGAQSFMVRVPRSRRSVMQNVLLSPLSLLEIDFDYEENRRMQRLVDVRVSEPYQSLPYNPMKQTIALFLSEFLYYGLREEQVNPELFAYLEHSLLWLDNRTKDYANFPVTFLIRLSRFLGIWPDMEEAQAALRGDEVPLVPLLLRMDFATMHLFRFSREERARVMQVINDYYRLHVPHFPELRSMAILREVLS